MISFVNIRDFTSEEKSEILSKFRTRDPVEQIIEAALIFTKQTYTIERDEHQEHPLDFHLPEYNVAIEVKQFHSDRIAYQMKKHPNVIAVQGREAALLLAKFISGLLKKE